MNFFEKYKYSIFLIVIAGVTLATVNRIDLVWTMIRAVGDATMPLIIGVFIAFIMELIVSRYENRFFPKSGAEWLHRARRPICIVAAIITVAVTVSFVLYMAIPQTIHSISLAVTDFPFIYSATIHWIQETLYQIPYLDNAVTNAYFSKQSLVDTITGSGTVWMDQLVSTVGGVVTWVINGGLGFFFALYLLFNKRQLQQGASKLMEAYCKPQTKERVFHVLSVFGETFSSFFVGQFIDAIILGVMVTVGMLIFQIPYATNIGCVVGLTALIPLLGAYIGALIGVTMLLVESPFNALIFLSILIVMQQIEGNFIFPKVVGESVGLPGIWVFAAVVIGGGLFGIIGILFSVPLGAAVYKLLWEDAERRLENK